MFGKNKKLVAAILTAALALTGASAAFAAGSPVYNKLQTGYQDLKTDDTQRVARVKVSDDATNIKITRVINNDIVTLGDLLDLKHTKDSKDPTGKYHPTTVGQDAFGKNTKTKKLNTTKAITKYCKLALRGSNITQVSAKVAKNSTLYLNVRSLSRCPLVTFTVNGRGKTIVYRKAFTDTKVENINLKSAKVTLAAGSGKGIDPGNKTTWRLKNISRSKDLRVSKDAFDESSKEMTVVLDKTKISKNGFEKIIAKLRAGGFQGTIVRR